MKRAPLAALLAFSTPALAGNYSARVQSIFDKQNRDLDPPPKSLRADSAQANLRYSSGMKRLNRKLASEGDDEGTAPASEGEEVSADINPQDAAHGEVEARPRARRKRRGGKKREHTADAAFDGERVLGIGLIGAGAYGVFGAEVDFGIEDRFSLGFGLGTGMTYATWSAYGRYYFNEGKVNPFFQGGYANWYIGKTSTTGSTVKPEFLANRFFGANQGIVTSGTRLHLLYPSIGVLFQSQTGLALTVQLEYLISMKDFNGALYGGFGFHYYF